MEYCVTAENLSYSRRHLQSIIDPPLTISKSVIGLQLFQQAEDCAMAQDHPDTLFAPLAADWLSGRGAMGKPIGSLDWTGWFVELAPRDAA
jgi:hypothetical protein